MTDKRLVEDVYLDRHQVKTRDAVRTIGRTVRETTRVVPKFRLTEAYTVAKWHTGAIKKRL